jgi:hypothetical protein
MRDERLHHLTQEAGGRWVMRVTIEVNPKMVGKQIKIHLGKCSEEEAIRQRDSYLRVLSRVGVMVTLRKQRPGDRSSSIIAET